MPTQFPLEFLEKNTPTHTIGSATKPKANIICSLAEKGKDRGGVDPKDKTPTPTLKGDENGDESLLAEIMAQLNKVDGLTKDMCKKPKCCKNISLDYSFVASPDPKKESKR